ncbi:MAG: RNA 2'-phosphotransferase [Verrucomicrobiales bacterium]|nr:RNA 2'-phosphotransferase [Verrucomicrobiales bacterium]
MNAKLQTKISRRLSLILRHKPESIGITLNENGWADVQGLLEALNKNGFYLTLNILKTIVAENPKKRFEFDETGTLIRARQGHSVEIDLGYSATTPPDVLYHGTAERFLSSILSEGLTKQQRHHVHMSTDIPLMLEVARRRGKAALIEIAAKEMQLNGYEFYVTENQVWLTDHVPARYLAQKDS